MIRVTFGSVYGQRILPTVGDDPEDYHPYYSEDRPYDLKTNKEEYDFSELANLIRIIDQNPDSIEQVISMKEVMQYFAINILTGSWDDYRFFKEQLLSISRA